MNIKGYAIAALAALLCFNTPASGKEPVTLHIIPQPQSVVMEKGGFKMSGAAINCDDKFGEEIRRCIQAFANDLTLASGKMSSFAAPNGLASTIAKGNFKGVAFLKDGSLEDEEYSISVSTRSVLVKASSLNGVLYAIETIKQMLPEQVYGHAGSSPMKMTIPCVTIKDKPRFGYRGMHLDCSRHFFSIDEIKKYLDVMAMYKLNRFHWHLTDDQGWRIEIKQYPELTIEGAFRSGTMIGRDFNSNDGIRYGGYYTQEQVKDIIAYAARKGITVIPEIDLPGHMLAALSAYPELGCSGGPYEPWTKWGVSEQVLCPGKEDTFTFLEGVLSEIAELFPSEYIHIGGDECPKSEWENCPDCQALITKLGLKDVNGFSAEQYLQCYVTARMQEFLAGKGKKIIGWDEILEGELAEGATVMSWRGVDGGIKAAELGFNAIMTPTTYCYFDYCQAKEKELEPIGIGGYIPLETIYGYEPMEGMPAGGEGHVLGVQANLWTEYIASNEHLEYMLLPRMLALSEVQWCKPENKDFDRFKDSLTGHHFGILDRLGYTYSKVILGIHGFNKQ
ncbi:MAG: beta-N-acetylhexosaminidase [Rikenellaceae bacterium]|nr:beta-N-acetylhexosaminidase [Rikenellaceae bacterium]